MKPEISVFILCNDKDYTQANDLSQLLEKESIFDDVRSNFFLIRDSEIPDRSKYIGMRSEFSSDRCIEVLVPDDLCISSGFKGFNLNGKETHIQKEVIAMDKLFYFLYCHRYDEKMSTSAFIADNIVVMEADIFVKDMLPVYQLIKSMNDNKLDFVHAPYSIRYLNEFNTVNYMMNNASIYFDTKEIYHIPAQVFACNWKFMEACFKMQKKKNRFTHHETFLIQVAILNKDIKNMVSPQLTTLFAFARWGLDFYMALENNFFHPVKNNLASKLHDSIKYLKKINYNPNPSIDPNNETHFNIINFYIEELEACYVRPFKN